VLGAEQQVGAVINMFSLWKWAKPVINFYLVKPFVDNSVFKLPAVTTQAAHSNRLCFSNYLILIFGIR